MGSGCCNFCAYNILIAFTRFEALPEGWDYDEDRESSNCFLGSTSPCLKTFRNPNFVPWWHRLFLGVRSERSASLGSYASSSFFITYHNFMIWNNYIAILHCYRSLQCPSSVGNARSHHPRQRFWQAGCGKTAMLHGWWKLEQIWSILERADMVFESFWQVLFVLTWCTLHTSRHDTSESQSYVVIQAAVKWSRTRLEILFISFVLKRSSSPPRMFNTHGFGIESTRQRFLPGCCKKHDRRGMGGVLADQTPADFDETLATSADHSPAFSLTSVAPRKTVRQLALTPALTGF